MKIPGMLFLILAVTACATQIKEEKFVNPVFYTVMEPLSTNSWYTQITPTEMLSSNNKGAFMKQKCTLIENTMKTVTLQCEEDTPDHQLQYSFNLGRFDNSYKGWVITLITRRPISNYFLSEETLIIH